jgi:signal transduction histidine kinase
VAAEVHSTRRHAIGVAVVFTFLVAPSALESLGGSGNLRPQDLVFFITVVALVPLTLVIGLRWGERRRRSATWTVVVAYGLAAASGAAITTVWQFLRALGWYDTFNRDTTYAQAITKGAYLGMGIVGLWGMFMMLPRAVHEAREHEREHQELRREAERARVRAALEPHFVLNTLNAISGLIGDSPEVARSLVGDLGDLLRDVVRLSEEEMQPAAAEVAWLQRYARILEARHQGRLVVEWLIDPAAAAIRVPVLVLQPLLENAIQHGALQRPGGGRVRVELRVADRMLQCIVEDDGPGMSSEARTDARGLALTRRRLACDAPGSTLTIDSTPTGTRATVQLAAA